jgi:hypothetical protein
LTDNVTDEAYARGAGPTNFQPGIDYKAAVRWTQKW